MSDKSTFREECDALGAKMKALEHKDQIILPKDQHFIVRLDGHDFSS